MAARTTRPNKRTAPGRDQRGVYVLAGVVCVVLVVLLAVWGAATATGTGHGSPAGWVSAAGGGPRWSGAATVVLVLGVLLVALLIGPLLVVGWRQWRRREWTDSLAKDMHTRRDLQEITAKAAVRDAERLGAQHTGTGLVLGRAVLTRQWLYGLYEWSQVWIMGPRAGKSRSVAVPQLVTHRGPAVVTSNKPDLWGWTRWIRASMGRVLGNDPQGIVHAEPDWYWDVISFVTTVERGVKLAQVWSASRSSGDKAGLDPYFEPEGQELMASMLLAARVGGQPVTRLTDWLSGRPPVAGVPDPCEFLDAAGLSTVAKDIRHWWDLDDGQRDGVFGTARSYIRFLRDPRYVRWVARTGAGDRRPSFDVDAFVRSEADTLYLLSKEGPGSARALTAALTLAVYTAAEDYAEQCGGRVPNPVLFLLDEAANVCRWPELPSLYSHAGGKGIILVTIVQSQEQGNNAWPGGGFATMWSAANVAAAGRGINDADHLRDLAVLIGDRQVRDSSKSTGTKGHRSTSRSNTDERIFAESDLRALPRGRAILMVSGARSILLALVDYSQHEWAWQVEASAAAGDCGV